MKNFIQKALQKTKEAQNAKTLKKIFKSHILQDGITKVTTDYKTFSVNLTLTDLKEYANSLKEFLRPNETEEAEEALSTLNTKEEKQKNTAITEIAEFFKILPEKIPKKQQQIVANVFLDLLQSQNLKITDLLKTEEKQKSLDKSEFSRFLQLDDSIINKYLKELSDEKTNNKKDLNYIKGQFTSLEKSSLEKIISYIDSVPASSSKLKTSLKKYELQNQNSIFTIPLIQAVKEKLNNTPTENLEPEAIRHLNSIFVKHLKQDENNDDLLKFILEFNNQKTLALLDTETLRTLTESINIIPINLLQNTYEQMITQQIEKKFVESSYIKITTAPRASASPQSSDKQNPEDTSEQDNNLKELLRSKIFTSPDYSLEETGKSKGYHIKDNNGKQVFSVEQTPTGSIIKIPEHNTDILVKILEGLANDSNTKDISVSGLSKENIKDITKNLDTKISANKEKYKQTLQKLINKLGDEDGNKELVTALKQIQQKYINHEISVSTETTRRLSKVEQGPYPPPNPTEQQRPFSAPATIPNTPQPNSAPPRRRP